MWLECSMTKYTKLYNFKCQNNHHYFRETICRIVKTLTIYIFCELFLKRLIQKLIQYWFDIFHLISIKTFFNNWIEKILRHVFKTNNIETTKNCNSNAQWRNSKIYDFECQSNNFYFLNKIFQFKSKTLKFHIDVSILLFSYLFVFYFNILSIYL